MEPSLAQRFSLLCGELCNLLYVNGYEKDKVNSIIDELNANPFKTELIVQISDASAVITALCLNIKPQDEFLSAKTSHLINNLITKQNLEFSSDYLWKVISWHVHCLKLCSDIVLPDILHNMQCILHYYPNSGGKFIEELIGKNGILLNFIDINLTKVNSLSTQDSQQLCLMALKCICSITSLSNEKIDQANLVGQAIKNHISIVIVSLLMKGSFKPQDEFLNCKIIISALRVLSQLYYNEHTANVPLPEVMGISKYFILYGLSNLGTKPERIMPSQQTIAAAPIIHNSKGGKKQKLRKQRNNAIEGLRKEIPVSDRSLIKDISNFENNAAYKPASQYYLEPHKIKNSWILTSDSDMSDIENSREAKLVALKSRVRQSASNLLLVLVKITEKKDMFGYWWALLPDSPEADNWLSDEAAKNTLAYCAVIDPIASSRAGVLSVILAMLSGSKMYLSQAETSKRDNASFIPFSVSLGYIITCMHKVLISILDSERSHSVIIVALKCCAALVQATPYHKMKEGLVSELVRSTRKFLIHRDVTLQVGALITMGCVLSIDPKIDEVIKSIQKDSIAIKPTVVIQNSDEECEDFEEGYSDDEMFTAVDLNTSNISKTDTQDVHYFKSWVLDICFKNMGWLIRGDAVTKCKPSAIPIILESLQVLSAVSFHHLQHILQPHLTLVADLLSEMLQHDHHDVILQAARVVSVIGDAIQKLEQTNESPPLNQCVLMWEKYLIPLSTILQCHSNAPVKAVACDCIANIGEKAFKELPRRTQMVCCTLVLGACGDEEAGVRAAAVRALAMLVMYAPLREDICFVSDCGESILRAIVEPSLVVRAKAAWALATLSDALVLNSEEAGTDQIDDDLLQRLLETSIQCASDNDKVKMSATRGLGNLLRLIKDKNLRQPQMKTLCEAATEKLLDCANKGNNMKVRWNACYAIGNAMKNEFLLTSFDRWQREVIPSLCKLMSGCKNLKVRINAAAALRSVRARGHLCAGGGGAGRALAAVWGGVLAGMEAAANNDDYTEYIHRDNLIEQLCVTLAHMCCLLQQSDLSDILDPLTFHFDCAKSLYTQLYHKLPPENASCMTILQAAKYVTVDLTAATAVQQQALAMLQEIFIWDL